MQENLLLILLYLLIIYFNIFLSKKLSFYDTSSPRSVHNTAVLNTSGISLYVYIILFISIYELSFEIEKILTIAFFITLFGFIDDRKNLPAITKIILLSLPTIYLIFNGYLLEDLGDYEYLDKIKLGKFSIVFTILACGLLINSYNYIDGIDGLLLCNILTSFFYIIFLIEDENLKKIIYILSIPLVINLIFNFLPKKNSFKIFLGNSGSLLLGFFMSFFLIYLYKYQNIHPAFLIWICWLPVYDFLFVTFYRIKNNKKFFLGDNTHLHHYLLKLMEKSHIKTTILICIINIIIIFIGYQIAILSKFYSLYSYVFLFLIYIYIRNCRIN
jgi:UDP-GlcNAc:undecaprenyl-phosphate GlcNAc-1-phosphate transferase